MPDAKMGMKNVVIGIKPQFQSNKPKTFSKDSRSFTKSVRVSGLDPSVSVDQLNEYITKNTPLVDVSRFRCQILVKKGQNLNDLVFLSRWM